MKGWIALDIDGTITLDKYSVPDEVTAYLRARVQEGWNLALATGRPFAFASMAVAKFDFPFLFLPQNGSIAIEMPGKKILFKRYMQPQMLPSVEEAYQGVDSDFLIYAGFEKGDFCYWRPHRMSEEDMRYLHDLKIRQKEEWQSVKDFKPSQFDPFPLIKCFGPAERMEKVAKRLIQSGHFQVSLIRDPFEESYKLILVTLKEVTKGHSLEEIFRLKGRGSRVIAAGDDENDISLLQVADVKIAMDHAPQNLLDKASLIAPPTKDLGIIHALKLAIEQ